MLKTNRIRVDFGSSQADLSDHDEAQFVLAPPRLWTALKIISAPNLWVGESFIGGAWYLKKGNLSDFLRAIIDDANAGFRKHYEWMSTIRAARYHLGQFILNRYYTRKVRKHYEVDPKIYELILDDEMVYTCAFFCREQDNLHEAQQTKLTATIARMALSSGKTRVLDIGCGWGAMERALVRMHSDVEVCGLSISKAQIEWAKQKDEQSLSSLESNRIEYRVEDYVDHQRVDYYDAVSVIGMIEHVGLGGYDNFFAGIHGFLRRGGKAIIHTIASPMAAIPTNSWIDRHIFPGGYAPSISELTRAVERHPFRISGIYVYPQSHYRRTIEMWLANLTANRLRFIQYLKGVNYSDAETERFMRIWIFYLSSVRNMFAREEGCYQVVQLTLDKI